MNIAGIEVGPEYPCRVTAEISCNHAGSKDRALALIDCAYTAGADLVKFQAFTLSEILLLRGDGPAPAPWDAYTKRQLYELVQTPLDWFPDLFAHARDLGIIPFSTVMGLDSLAICAGLDCPAYKLASYEAEVDWLRYAVLETGKPLILSSQTPVPTDGPGVIALYCPPGYPCMSPARWDFRKWGDFSGASLHTNDVETVMGFVQDGAEIIEVHLMLDADQYDAPPQDVAFSYTPSQLADLVQRIGRL